MAQVHVDNIYSYYSMDDTQILTVLSPLGGCTIIWLPIGHKPRLPIGPDEVIFRRLRLNKSCWTVDCETILQTKGLGTGVVVSAFIFCALGFGMEITI